jgi:DNA-binding transcriptional LysR family regulator
MRKVNETPLRKPLPRNLDVTLLQLFDCVRRTGNLSAAGAELGMSQPAVSRALARLREMYGDPLFIRRPRGVAATPFAETLAAPVASALETLRGTFQRPTFDGHTERRAFRVALSDIGERLFLPRLMGYLAQYAPGIAVEAISPSQGELQESLQSGRVDLAVGFLGHLNKQMRQRRLFRERFVYVARQGHPVVNGKLRREQLRVLPHVVGGPKGMEHAAAVEKVLAGPRVKARVALRVHSFLCIGPVVADTNLIGVVPSNLAAVVAAHIPLQLIEPPVQFPGFEVAMAWHERFHRDPGSEWLRETLVALFNGLRVEPPA